MGGANVVFRLFSSEPMMGAMWFCPTLFFASIFPIYVLWIGNKFKKRKNLMTIFFMVLMVGCGEIALKVFNLKSPYAIWQNMIISGILFEGWLYRKYLEKYMPSNRILLMMVGMCIAGVLLCFCKQGWLFNLQAAHVKEVPAIYLLAVTFLASIMVYIFSDVICGTKIGKIAAIIGNHSFSIMLLHFLAFKLVNLIICISEEYPLTRIADFPTIRYGNIVWLFAYLAVGCAVPIGIVKIKNLLLSKI